MPSRAEERWLRDILFHIDLATEFVAGFDRDTFKSDLRTLYAVTRCLEIISEAARRLRGPQQERFPDLEWRQIEDSGNVFRHLYQHVAESVVWMTVQHRLRALVTAANAALDGDAPRTHEPK